MSFIVPSYLGLEELKISLPQIIEVLNYDDEVVLVLNGPDDGSYNFGCELAAALRTMDPALKVIRSNRGLGSAYAAGIEYAEGEFIVLSVDDLPFGFSDWHNALSVNSTIGVVTGTKGHRESTGTYRGFSREFVTLSFRVARRILLKTSVRDTQGTFFGRAALFKDFIAVFEDSGFLWTAAFVTYLERTEVGILEVPIAMSPTHSNHASRVRVRDVIGALKDIWKIRQSAKKWKPNPSYQVSAFTFPAPKRIEK